MAKTVKSVKNSLKFKANVKDGILSVRVGVKKYALPVQARILSDGEFMFLSFTASSELYRIDGKKLTAMPNDEDATAAYTALNPGRSRRRGRRRNVPALPAALEEALRNIPAGYRLGFDATGTPRLVKRRQRRK
jgi:hypothetical protein